MRPWTQTSGTPLIASTHSVENVHIVITDALDNGDLGLTRGGLHDVGARERDAEALGDEVRELGVRGACG